jgi:hypothetical protein
MDTIKTVQTGRKSQEASIMEKFPEDFDIKDELKLDKEVYKFTGEKFDINQELQSDKASEEK